MLPRSYRLPLEPRVRFLGQPHHTPSFTLVSKSNSLPHPRLAVIVPKSAVKLSTHRHRLVRQLHAEFMLEVASLPALDLLLIVKSPSLMIPDFAVALKNLKSPVLSLLKDES